MQTHASIRKNFLEETCEALEAIDADDAAMMREELGDVQMCIRDSLYSAKTHLHQPVQEVSTVNAPALPADAPEGALPSEVRPEIDVYKRQSSTAPAPGSWPRWI